MGLGDKLQDLKNTIAGEPTTRDWTEDAPRYRQHWQEQYGKQAGRWEESEPAYRFGWEGANDRRFHNRTWSEAEPELRRDWERRQGRPPWDQAKDWARDAWNRTIQLREEELVAHKRPVEAGAVTLGKEVVSEQKTLDVPVTREEVVLDRHAVDRRPSDKPIGEGETIRVPVREEQVDVQKQTVVREEVDVGKRAVQDTQRVEDTVRREELRVEEQGNVKARGSRKTDEPERRDPPRR